MSRRTWRMIFIVTAAAFVAVVAVATILQEEKNSENKEEYGTMKVYDADPEETTTDETPAQGKQEADVTETEADEKHEVVEAQEYDWFWDFRDFYECAMSKQGKSYGSDASYIGESLQTTAPDAQVPGEDLNAYYDGLEHLDLDSAIAGDLVFFFDGDGNAVHMGVKGYNNHMYDLKDGVVTYEYISDHGGDFAFARVIQTSFDAEEMEAEQEKTGYRHAGLYAAEDDMDLGAFDSFKDRLLTELNNKFSSAYPGVPVSGFYVIDMDTEAYEGKALNATVASDGNGHEYVVRYIYEMDKLYIL